LVTFIACEIVTGSQFTEILGSVPARFSFGRRGRGGSKPVDVALR
jgi:hypothetical protein